MKQLSVIPILLMVLSCAPIRVNYDYERNTDFSKYKTYNYYANINSGLSELDTKRLFDALDAQLQAKGLQLAETPDFFIDIKSSTYQERLNSTVGLGMGGTGRHVGGGVSIGIPLGQSQVNRHIQFDFVDEKGKGLFWQAVSESSFHPKASPEVRESKLRAVVSKVLQGFPPKN